MTEAIIFDSHKTLPRALITAAAKTVGLTQLEGQIRDWGWSAGTVVEAAGDTFMENVIPATTRIHDAMDESGKPESDSAQIASISAGLATDMALGFGGPIAAGVVAAVEGGILEGTAPVGDGVAAILVGLATRTFYNFLTHAVAEVSAYAVDRREARRYASRS